MKQVFTVSGYRLEVTVARVRSGQPPTITMYLLDDRAAPTVGFRSSGHRLYHGTDRAAALSILLSRAPNADRQMHSKLREFFRPK